MASNTQVWPLICLGLGLGRLECKDKQLDKWALVALLPLAWCVFLRVRLKTERDRDRERGVREGRNRGREGGTQSEREEKNRVRARARSRKRESARARTRDAHTRERECVSARVRGCIAFACYCRPVFLYFNIFTESEVYTLIAANTLDAATAQGNKACSASPCQQALSASGGGEK